MSDLSDQQEIEGRAASWEDKPGAAPPTQGAHETETLTHNSNNGMTLRVRCSCGWESGDCEDGSEATRVEEDHRSPTQGGEAEARYERIAKEFHQAYEELAPIFGYRTREESAKPWKDVPRQNQLLMIATVKALIEEDIIRFNDALAAHPSLDREAREPWEIGTETYRDSRWRDARSFHPGATICEGTGAKVTDKGVCPVHKGDACLVSSSIVLTWYRETLFAAQDALAATPLDRGEPTDEEIERGARALCNEEYGWDAWGDFLGVHAPALSMYRTKARTCLTAANTHREEHDG